MLDRKTQNNAPHLLALETSKKAPFLKNILKKFCRSLRDAETGCFKWIFGCRSRIVFENRATLSEGGVEEPDRKNDRTRAEPFRRRICAL